MSNGNQGRRLEDRQGGDTHLHFHFSLFGGQQDDHEARKRHAEIMDALTNIRKDIMDRSQEISQNLKDIRAINAQYLEYIKAQDARIAEKDAAIAAAVKEVADGKAELADLNGKIAAIIEESQSVEDDMRAGIPHVPPVGGSPLLPNYPSVSDFNTAVAAYTGPERVNLDGGQVNDGTEPSLDYFSHSADGTVNTSGPSD